MSPQKKKWLESPEAPAMKGAAFAVSWSRVWLEMAWDNSYGLLGENGLEVPGITAMDLPSGNLIHYKWSFSIVMLVYQRVGSMEKSPSSAASQGERIPVRNASAFSNSIPSQSAGFGGPLVVGNPFSTWRFRWRRAV